MKGLHPWSGKGTPRAEFALRGSRRTEDPGSKRAPEAIGPHGKKRRWPMEGTSAASQREMPNGDSVGGPMRQLRPVGLRKRTACTTLPEAWARYGAA